MKPTEQKNGAVGATPTAPSEPFKPDAPGSVDPTTRPSQSRDVVEVARDLVQAAETLEHVKRRLSGAAARLEIVAMRARAATEQLAELRAELRRLLTSEGLH